MIKLTIVTFIYDNNNHYDHRNESVTNIKGEGRKIFQN